MKAADFLRYMGPDGWPYLQPVWKGSVLDELRYTSEDISRRYLFDVTQAIGLILMDVKPVLSGISVQIRKRESSEGREFWRGAQVTLCVEPWVSAARVTESYRRAQKQLLRGENRPLSMRNLALFSFVVKNTPSLQGFRWHDLMEEWNRSKESQENGWGYTQHRLLRRDFVRARDALLQPFRDDIFDNFFDVKMEEKPEAGSESHSQNNSSAGGGLISRSDPPAPTAPAGSPDP
jgi:hypothetical protein